MLAKQVLFEIQHFGKIIAAQLHSGLADFLPRGGKRGLFLQQQNLFLRIHQELPRQAETGETGPDDDHIVTSQLWHCHELAPTRIHG